MTSDATIPNFRRGVRFRFDEVRQSWVLLAPEKLFLPDDIAVEILKLVDGTRSLQSIVDDLASRFEAPRTRIAEDVTATLTNLSDRGVIHL